MPNYKGFMVFKKPVICVDCGKTVSKTGAKQKRCSRCQNIYRLKMIKTYSDKYAKDGRYREYRQIYSKNKRKQVRAKLFSIVGHSCKICGYNKFSCSLDFHHIDNSRKNNAKEHMNLCFEDYTNLIALCRNCHQAVHKGLLKL